MYRPPAELVDAYLGEIARGYGVSFIPPLRAEDSEGVEPLDDDIGLGDEDDEEGEGSDAGSGGAKEPVKEDKGEKTPAAPAAVPAPASAAAPRQTIVVKKPTPEDDLAARFERLKNL